VHCQFKLGKAVRHVVESCEESTHPLTCRNKSTNADSNDFGAGLLRIAKTLAPAPESIKHLPPPAGSDSGALSLDDSVADRIPH